MRWVVQLSVDNDSALNGLPGAAGRHEPGSYGGGDATWDVVAEELPTIADSDIHVTEVVALKPLSSAHVPLEGVRLKRTLLLHVQPTTSEDVITRFERSLAAMPRHIPSIRSWSLSRVDRARTPSRWTHVWEQEYETLDGLRVDYSRSSYHWAGVDRWFDGEMPDRIVDTDLVHVFYFTEHTVL